MIARIVEIADDHRYLSVLRGFMVVKNTEGDREEIGRVPLDDICALIANAHGITYSNNLLVALAERCVPFVLCGANHNAVGMIWPVDGNFQQAKRFDSQISASKPVHKRLWAEVVRSKLQQQASVLEALGLPTAPISALIKKVRSGDSSNIEAQAARRYWTLLFGKEFRRDRDADGINVLLNYGYTIYRAATARAVIAAGLHPTLGIHHSNEGNPMRLVDDLMEPFRPLIDLLVWHLNKNNELELSADNKRVLVRSLYEDMQSTMGATPVMVCMQKLAVSLAQVYMKESDDLELPLAGLPLLMPVSSGAF